VEEGSLSRTLVFDCGHDYAQKEYAMKTEREMLSVKALKAIANTGILE